MRRIAFTLSAAVAAACAGADQEPTLGPAPIEIGADGVPNPDVEPRDPSTPSASTADVPVDDAALGFQGRADINPTGNRVSIGVGDLDGPAIEVRLDSAAIWLVPSSPEPATPWAAVLANGALVWIDPVSATVEVLDDEWGDDEPVVRGLDRIEPWDVGRFVSNALLDGRSVADDTVQVVLTDPTDRYGHAVLGDDIEAAAIEISSAFDGGLNARVELETDVVEGRSALLGDADGDGVNEILVTQSNNVWGARLVLYDLGGGVIAESAPIGQGNRWRNQMAIGPVGPAGEIEIVDVLTPHLGRVLEWFRVEGDELVQVASLDGFTSHVFGSRNLDLAIVADADGDGALEVIAPTPDLTKLAVVARTDDGAEVEFTVDLASPLSSNVGAVDHPDGGVTYAAGTNEGLVRFWVN